MPTSRPLSLRFMLCPRLSPVLHRRRLLGMPRGIPAGRGAAGARGTPRRGAVGAAPRRSMPRGLATRDMRGLASLVTCLANLLIVFSSRVLISHTELGPIEDFIADKRLSVGELFDLATLDLADQPILLCRSPSVRPRMVAPAREVPFGVLPLLLGQVSRHLVKGGRPISLRVDGSCFVHACASHLSARAKSTAVLRCGSAAASALVLLCGQDVIARLGLALLSFAGINHRCPLPPFIADLQMFPQRHTTGGCEFE